LSDPPAEVELALQKVPAVQLLALEELKSLMIALEEPAIQYDPLGQICGAFGRPDCVFIEITPGGQKDPDGHEYVGILRPGWAHTLPAGHSSGKAPPKPGHMVPAVQVAQLGAPELTWYWPGGHGMGKMDPAPPGHMKPGGQGNTPLPSGLTYSPGPATTSVIKGLNAPAAQTIPGRVHCIPDSKSKPVCPGCSCAMEPGGQKYPAGQGSTLTPAGIDAI
jgi:hypothetical protein